MSTQTTDLIAAPSEPQNPPLKPHPPAPGPSRKRVVWAIAGAAVLFGFAMLVASLRHAQPPGISAEAVRTADAVRGNFVNVLRLSGTTRAVTSYPIVVPRLAGVPGWEMTIVRLLPNGAHVKRGNLLVEFDRQNVIENYLDHRAHYMDLSKQVAKQQKTNATTLAKDETDIQTAKDQVRTAQLDMQRLELLSRIDQEITRQKLEEAQASLKELQQTYKQKRAEDAASLRDLELQRDQAKRDMLHSLLNEQRMAIHSPINGIVVLHSIWKSGRFDVVEEGDQVRPGLAFMEVVNPAEMEVTAKVNQMDAARLRPGQLANVRFDAYAGLSLPARLETVGPIATEGQFSDRVRTFTAMFSIEEGDPRLMPDLSAAVDVDLLQQKDVLMVPNDCVVRKQGRAYVFVKSGVGFRQQEVKLGPGNNLMRVIDSGLKAGTVVERGVGQG